MGRVVIFRDALIELISMELGARFSKKAKDGWMAMLNWAGGAFVYTRLRFTDRLKILASSWATANNKVANDVDEALEGEEQEGEEGKEDKGDAHVEEDKQEVVDNQGAAAEKAAGK